MHGIHTILIWYHFFIFFYHNITTMLPLDLNKSSPCSPIILNKYVCDHTNMYVAITNFLITLFKYKKWERVLANGAREGWRRIIFPKISRKNHCYVLFRLYRHPAIFFYLNHKKKTTSVCIPNFPPSHIPDTSVFPFFD